MTRRKQLLKNTEKNTGNSENIPRRSVTGNRKNTASCGCHSIFSCCKEKKGATANNTAWDFPCGEYDVIVEKLVIKRVPIGLFATSYDVYKSEQRTERNKNTKTSLPSSTGNYEKMYPIVQAVDSSSLFYTSLNSTGPPPGFIPTRPASNNKRLLRFSRDEDVFADDALASTSSYNDHLTSRFRDAELLNKFTALHPNLKESERAPKDPCPLNTITRSRRSLAEEISEIGATKESQRLHYQRSRNELVTTELVHTQQQPGTSKELSALPVVGEIIPTRDKAQEISSRYKSPSSSCFPFGWRSENRDETVDTTATTITQPDGESLTDVQDSSSPVENQNFIVAPVQVHYTCPDLKNIRKIIRQEKNDIDAVSENKQKSNIETLEKDIEKEALEKSCTDGNSEAMEEASLDNLAGTTLRWKIIIKHHSPNSTDATSGTRNKNSQPILSKGLRDTIEAENRKNLTRSDKKTQKS